MDIDTIGPDENIRVRYTTRDRQLVRIVIESDIQVQSFVVRQAGLDLFDEGKMRTFQYYGGFALARKYHKQTLKLPFSGTWYLLIVNQNTERSAKIEYDVEYLSL